jgi:hypothetical protein
MGIKDEREIDKVFLARLWKDEEWRSWAAFFTVAHIQAAQRIKVGDEMYCRYRGTWVNS